MVHALLRTLLEGATTFAAARTFFALGGPIDPVAVLAVVKTGTTRTNRLKIKTKFGRT